MVWKTDHGLANFKQDILLKQEDVFTRQGLGDPRPWILNTRKVGGVFFSRTFPKLSSEPLPLVDVRICFQKQGSKH